MDNVVHVNWSQLENCNESRHRRSTNLPKDHFQAPLDKKKIDWVDVAKFPKHFKLRHKRLVVNAWPPPPLRSIFAKIFPFISGCPVRRNCKSGIGGEEDNRPFWKWPVFTVQGALTNSHNGSNLQLDRCVCPLLLYLVVRRIFSTPGRKFGPILPNFGEVKNVGILQKKSGQVDTKESHQMSKFEKF